MWILSFGSATTTHKEIKEVPQYEGYFIESKTSEVLNGVKVIEPIEFKVFRKADLAENVFELFKRVHDMVEFPDCCTLSFSPFFEEHSK